VAAPADLARGDVVRVSLDPVQGSETAGERPALVISSAFINLHSPVVLVAALTSRKVEKVYPFEALLNPPEGGLKMPSKALLMQLRSVDKQRIIGRMGKVAPASMDRINEALKIATGLTDI